jgi:hypothetical protein
MESSILCPGCQKRYPWKPELAGRAVQCQTCGHAFRIPEAPPQAVQQPTQQLRMNNPLDSLLEESQAISPQNVAAGPALGPLGASPLAPMRRKDNTVLIVALAGGGAAIVLLLLVIVIVAFSGKRQQVPPPGAVAMQPPSGAATPAAVAPATPANPSLQPGSSPTSPPAATPPSSPFQAVSPPVEPPAAPPPPSEGNRRPLKASSLGRPQRISASPFPNLPGGPEPESTENVVSDWSAKPDPEKESFELVKKKKSFPLQSGVEVRFSPVASPFVLLYAPHGLDQGCVALDLRTGKPAGLIKGRFESQELLAMSPDGLHIASGDWSAKDIQIWSFETSRVVQQVGSPDEKRIVGMEFLSPEQLLLVIDNDKTVTLTVFKVKDGSEVHSLDVPKAGFSGYQEGSLTISPGARYAALMIERTLHVCDLVEGELVGRCQVNQLDKGANCVGLAFSRDGTELAGVFEYFNKMQLARWNFSTGEVRAVRRCQLNTDGMSHARDKRRQLEWTADRSGLVLYGRLILEPETGTQIWQLPFRTDGEGKVVDADRLAVVHEEFGGLRELVLVDLPKEQLGQIALLARSGAKPADFGLPPLTKVDLAGAQAIPMPVGEVAWAATPDPAPAAKGTLRAPLRLGDAGMLAEAVAFSTPDAGRAVVLKRPASDRTVLPRSTNLVFGQPLLPQMPNRATGPQGGNLRRINRPEKKKDSAPSGITTTLECLDLTTGKPAGRAELPGHYELFDVSPDGTLALVGLAEPERMSHSPRLRGHWGAPERLDIWVLGTGKHAVGWRPYRSEESEDETAVKDGPQTVLWASFVDKRHVLTLNPAGKLVLWELPQCRPVYLIDGFGPLVGISPNRKYVAGFNEAASTFCFLDPLSGQCQGQLQQPSRVGPVEGGAFRADGKALAVVAEDTIQWDLATGKISSEFPTPPVRTQGARLVSYLDDRFLLVNEGYLVDLKNHTLAWIYQLPDGCHASGSPDGRHWFCLWPSHSTPSVLAALKLPGDSTKTLVAGLRAEKQIILQPGMALSLSVNVSVPGADAKQIETSIADRLRNAGYQLEPNAKLRLTFSASEQSTGKTVEYEQLGAFRNANRITLQEKEIPVKVAITDNTGQVWWEYNTKCATFASMMVRGDPQQLYDSGLRASFSSQAQGFTLPAYLFHKAERLVAGQSRLTAQGETVAVNSREGQP